MTAAVTFNNNSVCDKSSLLTIATSSSNDSTLTKLLSNVLDLT